MKTRLYIAFSMLSLVFLSACGGGGGSNATPTVDTTAPVITLTCTNPINIDANTTYVDAGATASDNLDGDITDNITTTSTVDSSTIGTYSVTYNVNDAAGNSATAVVRIVNVVDTTAPVIILTGTNPVVIEVNTIYVDAGATASDNLDGDITNNITILSTVDSNTIGTYSVTYNISDAAGNAATAVVRIVNVTRFNFDNAVRIITPATDGSDDIYVGGRFTTVNGATYNHVARMNSDGTADSGFDIGAGMNDEIFNIAPANDGSGDVYVGGFFTTVNGVTSNYLVRMNSDGTVDSGFNIGTGMSSPVFIIAPATDGSGDVYVGGNFYTVNDVSHSRLVRMNSDGTVDNGFNIGTGIDMIVRIIVPAIDGSGDIYVGGLFTSINGVTYNRLVRMNSDGTIDNGFNIGTGMDDQITSIVPASDGSGDVYLGGFFTSINGVTYNRLVRLNSDGTVDTGFNIGTGMDNYILSISPAIDGSGDVYVAGSFTSINGVTYNRLARLNSDGTVDTGFNVGSGINNSVSSIASATDGSGDVYVGGFFTTVNGIASSYLVRINPDGTLE